MDHKDSQVGPQVGLGKAVLAGYKPGYKVKLEHRDKPQERVHIQSPCAHHNDLGKHTREYHPVHSAKRKIDKDLGESVQLRRSAVAKTTDTPPERYSPV